jgi:hypothetical protein
LRDPQPVAHYTVSQTRDYFKNAVALRGEHEDDPYTYDKMVGIDGRFLNEFHRDFYWTVVRREKNKVKNKAPIVDMCYVDWPHYEQSSYPPFKEIVAKCKQYGLYDIMEILAQFHASFYFNEFSNTIFWTTQGQKYCIDYMTFSRLLALKMKLVMLFTLKRSSSPRMSPSCSSILS